MLQQIFASLVSTGGLGLANYYIMNRLGVIDIDNNKLLVPFLLFCSFFNYISYLISSSICASKIFNSIFHFNEIMDTICALILTIILSCVLSAFVAPKIKKYIIWAINEIRKKDSKSPIKEGSIWKELDKSEGSYLCYIYDFSGKLIGAGSLIEKDNAKNSLILHPQNKTMLQKEFKQMISIGFDKDFTVRQYIDIDNHVTIYLVSEKLN